jgi:hypothetical protein
VAAIPKMRSGVTENIPESLIRVTHHEGCPGLPPVGYISEYHSVTAILLLINNVAARLDVVCVQQIVVRAAVMLYGVQVLVTGVAGCEIVVVVVDVAVVCVRLGHVVSAIIAVRKTTVRGIVVKTVRDAAVHIHIAHAVVHITPHNHAIVSHITTDIAIYIIYISDTVVAHMNIVCIIQSKVTDAVALLDVVGIDGHGAAHQAVVVAVRVKVDICIEVYTSLIRTGERSIEIAVVVAVVVDAAEAHTAAAVHHVAAVTVIIPHTTTDTAAVIIIDCLIVVIHIVVSFVVVVVVAVSLVVDVTVIVVIVDVDAVVVSFVVVVAVDAAVPIDIIDAVVSFIVVVVQSDAARMGVEYGAVAIAERAAAVDIAGPTCHWHSNRRRSTNTGDSISSSGSSRATP